MEDDLKPTDARQGRPRKMARKTLAWSLPLSIIGLAAVVILFVF